LSLRLYITYIKYKLQVKRSDPFLKAKNKRGREILFTKDTNK